ncbi:flagellar hook-basal body complex protein [Tabrizicola fusiformis]|uniref:flagellar hook-basal body complex protein n=1 Tax=Tabrizicola sp. SY72 TaxID=2741673 RepID=UPI001571F040|nr:flagellar hook-basal body complex protein [Tabrizicola sp. SY72]NTT86676.1 flagellar hook-basal body complex protein [Tabrizicola sp. SY72]
MDSSGYVTLARQSGLMREMQAVANNIANISTAGFRREGVIFAEHVVALGDAPSLSMASGAARLVDLSQADLTETGGTFDFAIRGEGFFLVDTPTGDRLTRSGQFTPGPNGELMTNDGYRLLDAGGAPVIVPPGATDVALAQDGTLSAGGAPFAQIGLWTPADPAALRHQAGTLFEGGELQPAAEGAVLIQRHLEESNVDPVTEMARMIEVQRAYELGQGFLDREDQRVRGVVQALGR